MLPLVLAAAVVASLAPARAAPQPLGELDARLRGNADINLDAGVGVPLGFRLGSIGLEATASVDPRVRVLARVAAEVQSGALVPTLEALEVRFRVNRFVRIVVGDFPTPLSWSAERGLRDASLRLSARAPTVLTPETADGVLPLQLVGVTARFEGGAGRWTIFGDLALTNGRSPVFAAIEDGGDSSTFKAPLAQVGVTSPGGLRVALGGSFDRIAPTDSGRLDQLTEVTDEVIASVSVVYPSAGLEVLAEGYAVAHRTETIPGVWNEMALLQVGYHFGNVTPYVLGEHLVLATEDPLYAPQSLARIETDVGVGVRYDFTRHAALKLEGELEQRATVDEAGNEGGSQVIAGHLQLCLGF